MLYENEFMLSNEKAIFDSITSEVKSQMEQVGIKDTSEFNLDEKTEELLKNLKMIVKYTPGLKFIGEGSSRYVYKLSDKYVLKAAKSFTGIIQNDNEIRINQIGAGDYSCFVRVMAYDPSKIFIVEDICSPLTEKTWASKVQLHLDRFVQIIRIITDHQKVNPEYNIDDLIQEVESAEIDGPELYTIFKAKSITEVNYSLKEYDNILNFLYNMSDIQNKLSYNKFWTNLYDIFRFYSDNGTDHLMINELPWIEQWGICGTGRNERIVLIDPGVNFNFVQK